MLNLSLRRLYYVVNQTGL